MWNVDLCCQRSTFLLLRFFCNFEQGLHHGHEAARNGVCRASENFAGRIIEL